VQAPDLKNVGSLSASSLGYKYSLERGASIVRPALLPLPLTPAYRADTLTPSQPSIVVSNAGATKYSA